MEDSIECRIEYCLTKDIESAVAPKSAELLTVRAVKSRDDFWRFDCGCVVGSSYVDLAGHRSRLHTKSSGASMPMNLTNHSLQHANAILMMLIMRSSKPLMHLHL